MDLRNLWEEEQTGLQVLGIGREGQERSQGDVPVSGRGTWWTAVPSLRRSHLLRGGRVLVGTFWVSRL